jgi:hypothetical protein
MNLGGKLPYVVAGYDIEVTECEHIVDDEGHHVSTYDLITKSV